MIIAAIADIESPQLALLEFLVCWALAQWEFDDLISGPLDIPEASHSGTPRGRWDVIGREWPYPLITYARPNLAPIVPSLLGTLQRHGLVVQNNNVDEVTERYQNKRYLDELERAAGTQLTPEVRAGIYTFSGGSAVNWPEGKAPLPRWSPTELGEQVFLRFRDAGTELPNVWTSGPVAKEE